MCIHIITFISFNCFKNFCTTKAIADEQTQKKKTELDLFYHTKTTTTTNEQTVMSLECCKSYKCQEFALFVALSTICFKYAALSKNKSLNRRKN